MNYKVTYKGGTNAEKLEERMIDAARVKVEGPMTVLYSYGSDGHALLIVPNDRIISIEKISA